jgi:hypothetical protein
MVNIDGRQVILNVRDGGCHFGYERLRHAMLYRDADVIVYCFSVAHPDTLECVRHWFHEVQLLHGDTPSILGGLQKAEALELIRNLEGNWQHCSTRR